MTRLLALIFALFAVSPSGLATWTNPWPDAQAIFVLGRANGVMVMECPQLPPTATSQQLQIVPGTDLLFVAVNNFPLGDGATKFSNAVSVPKAVE